MSTEETSRPSGPRVRPLKHDAQSAPILINIGHGHAHAVSCTEHELRLAAEDSGGRRRRFTAWIRFGTGLAHAIAAYGRPARDQEARFGLKGDSVVLDIEDVTDPVDDPEVLEEDRLPWNVHDPVHDTPAAPCWVVRGRVVEHPLGRGAAIDEARLIADREILTYLGH